MLTHNADVTEVAGVVGGGALEVGAHDEGVKTAVDDEGGGFEAGEGAIISGAQDNVFHGFGESGGFEVLAAETSEALDEVGDDFDGGFGGGEASESAVGAGVDLIGEAGEVVDHEDGW